ncbi:putative nucleotidyltransferase [Oscillatoria acuminata PCC 6304]|uniref:Putative nucleotidyltransferase n=2 Tax=Oscillatoria acuminata TaxID=118323 RepID=K9TGX0_9CYAN|nr:putative nucleotidyltransferase [Oscillatoria acuminata PCC 6304]
MNGMDTWGERMFDYSAARQYLQAKQQALQAQRLGLWQQARADSQTIIEMIIDRYAPQRIIQWGSVLAPQHFSEASDIDLAIAGLEFRSFMNLVGEAEDLTDFPLDLIRWEDIHPSFQKIILMKGKIIYEQR